jgi:hypothetical protein
MTIGQPVIRTATAPVVSVHSPSLLSLSSLDPAVAMVAMQGDSGRRLRYLFVVGFTVGYEHTLPIVTRVSPLLTSRLPTTAGSTHDGTGGTDSGEHTRTRAETNTHAVQLSQRAVAIVVQRDGLPLTSAWQ